MMGYDIYGNPLRRGHCEVHPHVHEEYPCSVCMAEKQSYSQQQDYDKAAELEHYLGQARQEIERLQKRNALLEDVAVAADKLNFLNQRRDIEPFDFVALNAALDKLREAE